MEDEEAGYDMEQLTEALKRARKLVAELKSVRGEAEESPREDLTAEQLTEGARGDGEGGRVGAAYARGARRGLRDRPGRDAGRGGHEEDDEEDGGQFVN
jgi:hypothetical protein